MINPGYTEERVRLCAARSLGLSDNMNDAQVLMESFIRTGIIDISIPEQSIMQSIAGDDFMRMLLKALTQFYEDGGWVDMTREEIEEAGGAVDDVVDENTTVFYRIANKDGTIPDPPVLNSTGDRIVVFH